MSAAAVFYRLCDWTARMDRAFATQDPADIRAALRDADPVNSAGQLVRLGDWFRDIIGLETFGEALAMVAFAVAAGEETISN